MDHVGGWECRLLTRGGRDIPPYKNIRQFCQIGNNQKFLILLFTAREPEGIIFKALCYAVHGGSAFPQCHRAGRPTCVGRLPPPHTTGYDQQAGGIYPTGMLYCYNGVPLIFKTHKNRIFILTTTAKASQNLLIESHLSELSNVSAGCTFDQVERRGCRLFTTGRRARR